MLAKPSTQFSSAKVDTVEIEMNDDTRVLKGVVREGGRESKGEARAEIVPR